MARENFEKAHQIALSELHACYDKNGIVAGKHNYDDYWTRDAGFGCLGALQAADEEVVQKQLEMLKSYQKPDGFIPFLIRKNVPGLGFLGIKWKTKPHPKYLAHKVLSLTKVIDSNAYYLITLCEYLKQKNSKEAFHNYKDSLKLALDWYLDQIDPEKGLVKESFIAGWNDGVYKSGITLMTNILVYRAVSLYIEVLNLFNEQIDRKYLKFFEGIKEGINRYLWNGKYFNDWVDSKPHTYFDANANLLSMVWGYANREQMEKILDFIKEHIYEEPFVKTVYPAYPWWRVEVFNRIFGMGDYWRGKSVKWIEPACLYVLACLKVGKTDDAEKVLCSLSDKVVEYSGVYEVYDGVGRPLKRLFYSSEYPYARGSALFVIAVNAFRKSASRVNNREPVFTDVEAENSL